MRIRREVVGALSALLLTACAAAAAGPDATTDPADTVSSTVHGVGVLPSPISVDPTEVTEPSSSTSTTLVDTTTTALRAEGNRILMLGDSVLASTSKRYSNDTCKALVPLGWRVEIEAEVSRGITFGNEVLARRKSAGWDAGLVFLGHNDGSATTEWLKALNRIITSFAPRPVVLVTVSEFKDGMRSINDTIRAIADVYPDQVTVLDWAAITRARPELLNEDGIHPSPAGREALAAAIAQHIGAAPTSPGECLASVFTDDSAGSIDGSGRTGTTVKPRPTPTTVKPSTPTTVKPGSSTTVPGGPSTTTGTTPPTTGAANTTSPPTTPSTTPSTGPPTAPPTVPTTAASTTVG
jgi:lysophospholipase L1-like esterase